jgi:ring-1,2-phenylacetyl-CoA epoxidase subunit PaaE
MASLHDFQRLSIAAVDRSTPGAIVVSLAVPGDLAETFRFRAGQHLAFRAQLDGQEVRRTYSLCSSTREPHLRVAIRRLEGGWFSGWANDTWRAGDSVEVLPPAGRFVVPPADEPSRARRFAAFAAGSGITPIISMIRQVMEDEPSSRFVLIYGNRSAGTTLFRAELEDLKDRHLGRLSLVHVLSRDEEAEAPLLTGRITGERARAIAERLLEPEALDHVFLCGPGSMIKDVRAALLDVGLPRERVHYEFFAAGGGAYRKAEGAGDAASAGPAGPALQAAAIATGEVVAVLDGQRRRFPIRAGETVIDAALAAGLKVPYSCKGGMCSTCRARVIEGSVTMKANWSLEPWELEKGFVLTCQAVPTGDRLVVDYDQM